MAQNSWGNGLIQAIGQAVDDRRAYLKLSAQQVADRTEALGHALSRSTIAGISNPARNTRLTVPDWLVLAAALDMPPLALLFPGAPAGDVEALPGKTVPALRAMDWATGEALAPGRNAITVSGGYLDMGKIPEAVAARWGSMREYFEAADALDDIIRNGGLLTEMGITEDQRLRMIEIRRNAFNEAAEVLQRAMGQGTVVEPNPAKFIKRYRRTFSEGGPDDG